MSGFAEVNGIMGHIGGSKPSVEQSLASMADWFTVKALSISGEEDDVDMYTKYPGLVCKQIANSGTSEATVIIKYDDGQGGVGDTDTVYISARPGKTDKLPPIHTIVKTGTSDNLRLYFQQASIVEEE